MLDDGQPEAGSLFLLRVVSIKNPREIFWRNPRAVVADDHFHRIIWPRMNADKNISFAVQGLARVLKEVYKNLQEMAPLHHQRRQIISVIAMNFDFIGRPGGQYLF